MLEGRVLPPTDSDTFFQKAGSTGGRIAYICENECICVCVCCVRVIVKCLPFSLHSVDGSWWDGSLQQSRMIFARSHRQKEQTYRGGIFIEFLEPTPMTGTRQQSRFRTDSSFAAHGEARRCITRVGDVSSLRSSRCAISSRGWLCACSR